MKLRIIPLSGLNQVGKNCTVFEYNKDIIVVDLGFGFPGPDLPGVDYLLPDIDYLKKNKNRIRGIVVTHGHLDHIGGISYLINELDYPPVFASKLSIGLIQDKIKYHGAYHKDLKLNVIKHNLPFLLGEFEITPFHVVHNIPDSLAMIIKTPLGSIFHTGDFKIDPKPADQLPIDKRLLKSIIKKHNMLVYMADSTNATIPGTTTSEKQVYNTIDSIVKNSKGRIIFTTFSTLISRIHQVIDICQKYNRKIVVAGLSIKKTTAIAQELGYLNIPPKLFVGLDQMKNYSDKQIFILASGTQGEPRSVMTRVSKKEYRMIRIKKTDTVVFSSSAIPGNELAIHKVMNGIVNQGAKILYKPVLGSGVHSSGHAFQQDLIQMLNFIKAKFFIPIHGEPYMRSEHIALAQGTGYKKENCFMLANGQILELDSNKNAKILSKNVVNSTIIVEDERVKILNPEVIKMRHKMAEEGVCVITISDMYFKKQKRYKNKINVIFKGVSAHNRIITDVRKKTEKLVQRYGLDKDAKMKIETSISDFLLNKIGKKSLVIVV